MMDWVPILLGAVAGYAALAYSVHRYNLWKDHVTFYGPIMAIKTGRVGFFDHAARFRTFLRLYGTLGVVMVVVVSVLMTFMLVASVQHIVVQRPAPTAANELKNVLAIPGVNDFIPFTFAVWFGLLVTMIVHEFGHAVLCRVEGIRVKTMGVLLAVIPVGAFVEPDEDDQEKTRGLAKMRMFGAGITNNILLGLACFSILVLLLGFAVPVTTPLIEGVYVDSPAYQAGVLPGSLIREVNGIRVSGRDDVARVLNTTRPGDQITLLTEHGGNRGVHVLTLASWPPALGERTGGFMGVTYYDARLVKEQFNLLRQPLGLVLLLAVPIYTITDPAIWSQFSILTMDSLDTLMWQVPFPQYWFMIQLLFWCGWFNLIVGTFNALPLLPLDGGYILKEGVDRILDRRGLIRYSGYVVSAISYLMLCVLIAVMVLPWVLLPKP